MNVHLLSAVTPSDLAGALVRFEAQFTYPLGPGRSFRICHGEDYPRFFRAMGEAACFVAERQGVVLGTIGAALRRLLLPNGQEQTVLYIGDLKIAAAARAGRTLLRLVQAVRKWAGTRTLAAFSVVMDGTVTSPSEYTGRLGIPPFQEFGKIFALRLATARACAGNAELTSDVLGSECYRRLSTGRYACPGGTPAERSEIAPLWLIAGDGRACGRLEDTRRAKRLVADDGAEMHSAHLSCFAFDDARTGAELLLAALRRAADLGFPALFVAVSPRDVEGVCQCLEKKDIVAAPATIYGTGFEPGRLWNINTAEI